MRLNIVGCSDAFSSGGRYHSCYLLDTPSGRIMIDCGANSPLALKRAGIAVSSIDAIIISHCHGDHYTGIPFLYLNKLFIEKTSSPIEIFGPAGIEARMTEMMESIYAGVLDFPRPFELTYHELTPGQSASWRGVSIETFVVEHFSGSPSLAVALSADGKRFAYSGDSGWCEGVIAAGRNADLYIVECTNYDTPLPMHLDYVSLAKVFDKIGARRFLLTHMSDEMLAARGKVDLARCILAEDGLAVDF